MEELLPSEADVQLLGQYGDAGLILRARNEEEGVDAYNGYFAGLRDLDSSVILGRADFGWREYSSVPVKPRVDAQRWYHLKFLAYECDFAVAATSLFRRDDNRGHARPGLPAVRKVRPQVLRHWRIVAQRPGAAGEPGR